MNFNESIAEGDLITVETRKHEALKTHKKGLMQRLFPEKTGCEK